MVSCPVLIGRDAERAVLGAALAAAGEGSGQLILMTGEAGIGKTRLVRELAAAAGQRDMVVLVGRAVPGASREPYRPFTEALLQGLRERDVLDDPELAPWRPVLAALIPPGGPDVAGLTSPGVVQSAALGEGVLQLLRRIAGGRGLLLALEDLHWADGDTLALLEYVGDNLSRDRLVCLATARLDDGAPATGLVRRLDARRAGTHVALGRLAEEEVATMVGACAPGASAEVVGRVQQGAEGVPFLVEELLAAPGIPAFFAESVRARLSGLEDEDVAVMQAAAMLGRRFDWRLLMPITRLDEARVATGLERGVDAQLLVVEDGSLAFRHALTRDAVRADMLPPRREATAQRALAALEAEHPGVPGTWGDLAAELAVQCGQRGRAGDLALASGRAALGRGALATAVDALRGAAELVTSSQARAEVDMLLLEALALAGRLDEALDVAERVVAQGSPGTAKDGTARAELHLTLAQAATVATRWGTARRQLRLADDAVVGAASGSLRARMDVLEAEIALADNDLERAGRCTAAALAAPSVSAAVRCQALELLGRIRRGTDLVEARAAFEEALATADRAGLVVWRLRAMHELGTIDMFDHAGTERLGAARTMAGQLGAAATGAVIDLQLAASHLFRFDPERAAHHARAALELSSRLELDKVVATALLFLAEAHALRRDHVEAERFAARALAAAPGDAEVEGSVAAGVDGVVALLGDDSEAATSAICRGVEILDRIATGPAHYRGLPALLLAPADPALAAVAIRRAEVSGIMVNRINRGFVGYARAIVAGSAGDADRADALAADAERDLSHYGAWGDIARLYAAPGAIRDGWGRPRSWLSAAAETFDQLGMAALADRSRRLMDAPGSTRWAQLGITPREADVLRLVADGLSNRDIAAKLYVSPRTVEKHVEALLRRTTARSRTELVAKAGPEHPR